MSERLKSKLCGVPFKNPVLAASGTFGFGREYAEFYDLGLLGGICTKGLTRERREGNDAPRIAETPGGILNSVGLQNPGVDAFLETEMAFLRGYDTRVIVNIAGNSEEDYVYMAERVSGCGADFVEMNISCPNVKAGGMAFGILPESVRKITESVKRACGLPLMVKLSPNVSCIADNARAAEDGGADCISLINTLSGMAVDLKGRKPLLANQIGGLSGPCVKPIALRMVWDCFRAVKIPIVGLGGISTAEDALEFILCGARLVQVGTANLSDPLAMPKIIEGMEEYCAKNGVKNVSELVGGLRG